MKGNVTALRRVRKTDNNRIARAVGATVVNRVDDLTESDVGTQCGLFEIEKIGDEYFTFLTKCKSPKACTILLRMSCSTPDSHQVEVLLRWLLPSD
jgi:T-complex protein 1 subunit gamma